MNKKNVFLISVSVAVFLAVVLYILYLSKDGSSSEEVLDIPYQGEINNLEDPESQELDFVGYEDEEFIDEAQVFISVSDQDGSNAVLISTNIFSGDKVLSPAYACSSLRLPIDIINSSDKFLSLGIRSIDSDDLIYRIKSITPNKFYGTQNLPSPNKNPCTNLGKDYEIIAALHESRLGDDFSLLDLVSQEYKASYYFQIN